MISQNPIYNLLVLGLSQQNPPQSPKSSRYTIAATPTKPSSNGASPSMMTITQFPSSTTSPMMQSQSAKAVESSSLAKSFFTPTKGGEKKMKKKQLEKEYQMLQDKVKIMEKLRNETDSDAERMKISLIDALTENDRLSKRINELEDLVDSMKSELNKGSYEAWKGYCSLQDSPPGVSTRYSKKRALNSNLNTNNL
ncbi:hypothetical protein PPL_10270 [Heterostelium album PN500]|uniref:Uncharacterized protein n=1 Tax=Heterostelium pallidum (strain ATCC 26659 / Pp 5 / PN500) TaxID=670386 RepID=D3BQT2_HETP5|nr:hypothetical protein PPL_10270 [Heterostelium album PN500]EFA76502.1 hypothetical protein PPL_10270 [Heterostelium album PN500]|eukprot:XP_020428634.1 hypothetical protein PPL_10270 [Heterostelium album PN500]